MKQVIIFLLLFWIAVILLGAFVGLWWMALPFGIMIVFAIVRAIIINYENN